MTCMKLVVKFCHISHHGVRTLPKGIRSFVSQLKNNNKQHDHLHVSVCVYVCVGRGEGPREFGTCMVLNEKKSFMLLNVFFLENKD